jgi:hypothetical protein
MMTKNQLKRLLKLYGCVFAAFFVSAVALAFICAAAQKPWKAGLGRQTAELFQEKGIKLLVGDSVPFASALGVSGAAFSLSTPEGAPAGEAVILRVATLYGPVPCVFVRGADGNVEFAGAAGVQKSLLPQFESPALVSRLSYWKRRVSDIALKTRETAR